MKTSFKMLAATLLAAASIHSYAAAETVLRLDEVAVGELDPAKDSDYADSILMYNLYDTLVIPKAGQPGFDPLLAASWETDGKTFTFDSASVQSILTEGSHSVDIDTRGFANRNIDGDVNFTNVTFVQANAANDSKFESSFELGGFTVSGDATVNGNMADFFKAAWDYLDDNYSYYNEAINSFGIDLGIKYALYLNAGGAPLTDIVAKFTADDNDAGSVPERLQTLHDNLLGNFDENSIADKFSDTVNGDTSSLYTAEQIYQRIQDAGLGDLLGVIGNIHDGRGIFSGNEGDIDGTGHNQVRVFDYQHGWDRPDFISFDSNGRVDSRAINVNEMYFGDGNTPNNYVIEQHEGAGVETALKVHFRTGNDILPSVVGADGTAIFVVPEGYQTNGVGNASSTNMNRAAWSFDYSLVAGLNGAEGDIDNFDFQLKVDTDKGAGVNYMVFNLEGSDGITPFVARNDQGQVIAVFGEDGPSSDGTNTDIAQDSVNFGFSTIKGAIGGGYAFGKGEFDIELTSYKDGTDEVLSNVHIRVIVDSEQFML